MFYELKIVFFSYVSKLTCSINIFICIFFMVKFFSNALNLKIKSDISVRRLNHATFLNFVH